MIKIFIAVVFIAELIITMAIIKKIVVFNTKINVYNDLLLRNKNLIPLLMQDIRIFLTKFNELIARVQEYFRQKKEEYTLKFLKTILIYTGVFLLKGKYKKALLAYQVIMEAYEGFSEA